MKHIEKLMKATVSTKKHEYEVIVDKYSDGRYKVVEGPDFLIGKEYRYGHGLWNRRALKYNTFRIIRNGKTILEKTYDTPKTENQLRRLAVGYVVDHDLASKWSFSVEYLNKSEE